MNTYRANGMGPETGVRIFAGTLRVSTEGVRFESEGLNGLMPLQGLAVRRGGHNDEQIFFEHPEFAGWSIYSSDAGLASDPILLANADFARELRAADRSRKSVPKPVVFGLAFFAIILGGLVLLWMQKDWIAAKVAKRVPISWEQKFGDRVFAQFEGDGTMLTNSVWTGAVSNITTRLVAAAGDSGYEFKFHIKQDTNVNAFAIPGGHVVILTGLLESAESAEEVAGVLAHEIAHVTRQHSLRNIIKSTGLFVMLEALIGDASGLLGMAEEASQYLLRQKFSRDFEREADDSGWGYLVEANIDPRGMTRFFEKLKAMTGGEAMENSLALVNTHPATEERIDALEAKWAELGKKEGFVKFEEWPKKAR